MNYTTDLIQSEGDPQGRSVGGTRGYEPRGKDTVYGPVYETNGLAKMNDGREQKREWTNEYACHTHVTMKGCFLNPLVQGVKRGDTCKVGIGGLGFIVNLNANSMQKSRAKREGGENPWENVVDSSYDRLMGSQEQMI